MSDKPGKIDLDTLLNSDDSSKRTLFSVSPKESTDGEVTFELDGVTSKDLERFKLLIEQPTDEIPLDFIVSRYSRDWAETFNGKIPSEWIKSGRAMIGFFDKMNSLPQSLYKDIPADWITAAVLSNPPADFLQTLATKYPLRLVDVITLKTYEDVEFNWTEEVYKIYKKYESLITQGVKFIRSFDESSAILSDLEYLPKHNEFCKISLVDFMRSRFHFLPNSQFLNIGHNLGNFRKTQSVKQIYNLIDNPSLNEDFMLLSQDYNTGPLNLDLENLYNQFFDDVVPSKEGIYWAAYHNFPAGKTLRYAQLTDLLTRSSLNNQKLDSELVDALITCPTQWSTLLNLSAFTKLSISQNTTLFTRILCDYHPDGIQQAIMNQLLLGTSVENIDISFGLALKNRIKLSKQAEHEGRIVNTMDFIKLLEETKAIENQKGFIESIGESIKEFLKLNKEKRLRKNEEEG